MTAAENAPAVIPHDGRPFDIHFPVAVIGGGAAGLVAALAARDAGAEVLILERDPLPRGSTAMSAGMIVAAGTRAQRAAGIPDDTPDLLAQDIQVKARGTAEPDLLRAICAASGPAVDWLIERHGLALELVDGPLYPGFSRSRTHAPASRLGADLIADLHRAALAAGVEVLTNAVVTTLIADMESGTVLGLVAERPDGARERIGCDALILATSGFAGNRDMVRRHIPEMGEAMLFGHEGNKGEAMIWGQALGAALCDMGAYQGHGAIATPHGALIPWGLVVSGVLVDAQGRRFAEEREGSSELAPTVLARPGGVAWAIFSEERHAPALNSPDYRQAAELGAIRHAATIDALATIIGAPASALAAALRECGKPTPPYCAVKVTGGLLHTQGGLSVDARARVLRADGTALPNLFAAGGAARGISGPGGWGYLSGNGLLSAVALGWIAGTEGARRNDRLA